MIPVVLHHGFFGRGETKVGPFRFPYFKGLRPALTARGHSVVVPRVATIGGVARRAAQLKAALDSHFADSGYRGKVIIVAHSMGGLDARYMIAKLGMEDRVAALLTVSTPHRGSALANWGVEHLGRRLGMFRFLDWLGVDSEGALDLTLERCARFNEETPDVPGVGYFSVSGRRPWHKIPPFALPAYKVVADAEGENDGIVSVKSSTWADHLGCWPADHWHTINHRLVLEFKNPTGDIVPYYLRALDRVMGGIRSDRAAVH